MLLLLKMLVVYLFHVLTQEIEKSHNQNRKTKDGTTDSNKGNQFTLWYVFDPIKHSVLIQKER